MQHELRREFDRLMDELSERGVSIGDDARTELESRFEEASELYDQEPDRGLLAENTDKLIQGLTDAADVVVEGGSDGGAGDYGPYDDGGVSGPTGGGEAGRYLSPGAVESAFVMDCFWPWCDPKKSRGGGDNGLG